MEPIASFISNEGRCFSNSGLGLMIWGLLPTLWQAEAEDSGHSNNPEAVGQRTTSGFFVHLQREVHTGFPDPQQA